MGPDPASRSGCRARPLTLLCAFHLVVCVLEQFGDHRLDVLPHIARLRQRGAVADGERHVQALGDRLREQRLPHAGRPEQQDVGLVQLHAVCLGVQDVAAVLVWTGRRRLGSTAAPLVPTAGSCTILRLVEGDSQAVVLRETGDVQQICSGGTHGGQSDAT